MLSKKRLIDSALSERIKVGAIREDGLRFRGYVNGKGYWTTEEKYQNLRKQAKEARQRKYEEDPFPFVFIHLRMIAKKRGIVFTIKLKEIERPTHCPLLGIKLVYGNKKASSADSASFDRIIPELGYVPGNVWIISFKANTMKNNATLEELETLTKNLRKKIRRSLSLKGPS